MLNLGRESVIKRAHSAPTHAIRASEGDKMPKGEAKFLFIFSKSDSSFGKKGENIGA